MPSISHLAIFEIANIVKSQTSNSYKRKKNGTVWVSHLVTLNRNGEVSFRFYRYSGKSGKSGIWLKLLCVFKVPLTITLIVLLNLRQ